MLTKLRKEMGSKMIPKQETPHEGQADAKQRLASPPAHGQPPLQGMCPRPWALEGLLDCCSPATPAIDHVSPTQLSQNLWPCGHDIRIKLKLNPEAITLHKTHTSNSLP